MLEKNKKITIEIDLEKIKEFIKNNKKMLCILVLMCAMPFFLNMVTYNSYRLKYQKAAFEKEVNMYPKDSFYGTSFITDTYPIFKDLMFVGDSYAHYLAYDLGFDVINYSCPGLKLSLLKNVFNVASKVQKKYVVIFIGPNDFADQTDLKTFYEELKGYVDMLKETGERKIILCTYLHSMFTKNAEKAKDLKYTIDMYNEELKKVTDEKNGIYYFDISSLNDLDKYSRYTKENGDIIHYNKTFYVDYINKLYEFLLDINEKEIK